MNTISSPLIHQPANIIQSGSRFQALYRDRVMKRVLVQPAHGGERHRIAPASRWETEGGAAAERDRVGGRREGEACSPGYIMSKYQLH